MFVSTNHLAMYYYKSLDQKRANRKFYVVHPDTIGGLNRIHKIMAVNAANERIQSSVMQLAYNYNRSESQRNDRLSKR